MANEQLTIQPNDARMTVIGKSWPDQASDSGGGEWDDTYNGTYSGPIPRTDLPTKIAVTTPPTKTEYKKSERIDFDGMVVTAYNEDDTVWTSAKYPDGTIPLNEIISTRLIGTSESSIFAVGEYVGEFTDYHYIPPKEVTGPVKIVICKYFYATAQHRGYPSVSTSFEVWAEDGYEIVVCPDFHRYNGHPYCFFSVLVAKKVLGNKPLYDEDIVVGHIRTVDASHSKTENIYASYATAYGSTAGIVYHCRGCYSDSYHYGGPTDIGSISFDVDDYDMSTFSCNVPLTASDCYGRYGCEDSASPNPITWAYLNHDTPKSNEISLYWSRPGDGQYLSCKLSVYIKPAAVD